MKKVSGQMAVVGGIIALVVGLILTLSVALPVLTTFVSGNTVAYNATNLSGFPAANTVSQQLPVLLMIGAVLLVVGGFLVLRT